MNNSIMFIVITLLFLARSTSISAMTLFAGVCDGRNGHKFPSPNQTVALYQKMNIGWIRLYEPCPDLLKSLQGTNILVAMGPKNEQVKTLAKQYKFAVSWIKTYIVPYNVAFNWIIVGNDVIPGNIGRYVPQAMKNIKRALTEIGISRNIHVTTVLGASALTNSSLPSTGIKPELIDLVRDVFSFLSSTNSPLMVKVYPYLAYASDPSHISLEYATFGSTAPVVTVDREYQYTNMFDAMVDCFNQELYSFSPTFKNVKVYVAETGWPTRGNPPYASVENARAYNQGLLKKLTTGIGATPMRPDVPVVTFFHEMFDENMKEKEVEKSYGFFTPNMVPVYDMWNVSVSS